MDEVFGSENFVGSISFVKTSGASLGSEPYLADIDDFLVWYDEIATD